MSFNATFQKLVQRHHDFDEICECFPNISHNHYGLIGEETVLKYSVCSKKVRIAQAIIYFYMCCSCISLALVT